MLQVAARRYDPRLAGSRQRAVGQPDDAVLTPVVDLSVDMKGRDVIVYYAAKLPVRLVECIRLEGDVRRNDVQV